MQALSKCGCKQSLCTCVTLNRREALKIILGAYGLISIGCGEKDAKSSIDEMNDADILSEALLALGQGISCPLDIELTPYEGDLSSLLGYAFVMGPIPWEDGTPIFNGDGAIMRFSTTNGRLLVKARRLLTPCALLDEASQGTEFAYQNRAFMRESSAFGARNFLNTCPVPTFDGRLLATYDAGRPWEVSPDTLELITPIGHLDQWKPMLPPLTDAQRFSTQSMSTAHPAFDDQTLEMFSVNYAPNVEGINIDPYFDLLWWNEDGVIKRSPLIDEDGSPCTLEMSCHQIHVTKRFVILIDSAVLVEPEQLFGLDVTRPQLAVTKIWVVERSQLVDQMPAVAQSYTVDSEAAHFLAAYEDQDGIELLLVHQCSSDPSEWVRANDTLAHNGEKVSSAYEGLPVAGADRLWLGKYIIQPELREVQLQSTLHGDEMWGLTLWTQNPLDSKDSLGHGWWISQGWHPELFTSRIAEIYKEQPNRTLDIHDMPSEVQPCRLMKIDHQDLSIIDQYQFEDGFIPLSPTYLPYEGNQEQATQNGMILTLIQGPNGCEVWFFEDDNLSVGPVVKCKSDELYFGHTLHTTWLSSISTTEAPYFISGVDELKERFEYLSPEARQLALKTFEDL